MKLKYEFETVELDDQIMAVPVGDRAPDLHGMLRLNETAADMLKLLKEETTEEALADALLSTYAGSREEVLRYVHTFVGQLTDLGLME